MAKIVDPDDLNQATEVVITPGSKTVQLLVAGNLNNTSPGSLSGVTMQALYSFLKEEWKSDNALNKFTFPLKAFTKNEFQWINGWAPADATTRLLLRDAGWQETVGAENGDLYAGFITLGNFDETTDQGNYQQVTGFNQTAANFNKTGNVNEAILVDDASGTDYTGFFKAFLRIQGKTYDSYNLLTEQGLSVLEATLYRFPLSNGTDLNIVRSDAVIDRAEVVTFTNATDIVNAPTTGYVNGNRLRFTGGTLPAELSASTTYYVISATASTFQVALTAGGTAVTFTDDGTATVTARSWPYELMTLDYLTGDHTGVTTWAASTAYVAGDIVSIVGVTPDRFLRCTVGGTSDTAEPTGAGADNTVTWEVDPGERLIGALYYHFSRIVDLGTGSNATRFEAYEWMQRQLRRTTDINDDINGDTYGTVNGYIADEMATFRGSDIVMEEGVFLDNLPVTEQNNIIFQPHDLDAADLGEVTYPFLSSLTFNFSANMVAATDADTRIVNYFLNNDPPGDDDGSDFDTASAIIVQDDVPANMDFLVTAASIVKTYDYDGNIQRGASTSGTDAPCVLQVVGLGDYENTIVNFTIARANSTINVTASDERNFANPV